MKTLISAMLFSLLLYVPLLAAGEQAQKRFVAQIDKDGIQRVEMVGGEYYFDPNHVVVKVNVPVELKIRKPCGITPHDFVLKAPEAGLDVKVSLSKEPAVVTFTAIKAGVYPFECSKKLLFFQSHKERGMHGELEVVE